MKVDRLRTTDGQFVELFVPETEEDHRWLRRNSTAVGGVGEQGDDSAPDDTGDDDWVDDPDATDHVVVGG